MVVRLRHNAGLRDVHVRLIGGVDTHHIACLAAAPYMPPPSQEIRLVPDALLDHPFVIWLSQGHAKSMVAILNPM